MLLELDLDVDSIKFIFDLTFLLVDFRVVSILFVSIGCASLTLANLYLSSIVLYYRNVIDDIADLI